jgi:hypothetical protein
MALPTRSPGGLVERLTGQYNPSHGKASVVSSADIVTDG